MTAKKRKIPILDYDKKSYKRHKVRPTVNRIFNIFDENKQSIKEGIDNFKNMSGEFQNKFEEFSDFSRDFVDDVFFKTRNIHSRFRYVKNQRGGREINVKKKR